MAETQKQKDLLLRAMEAAKRAEKVQSPTARDTWLQVAELYQEMAFHVGEWAPKAAAANCEKSVEPVRLFDFVKGGPFL